jgi:hypothetical protein
MAFSLTAKQKEAREILNGPAKYILLAGGSRSGKTFLIIRNIIIRSLKAEGSRHAVFRQTRKDLKESVWLDTYPKVLKLCAGGISPHNNEADLYSVFNNKSELWFGFLGDNKRADNVLGKEYNTLFFNEVSEISYQMFNKALTRLSLKNGLRNKVYCDCNPPGRGHWSYKLFVKKVNPLTGEPVRNPQDYAVFSINPEDNLENISDDYLDILDSLPEEERNRFRLGLWQEGISGAIFAKEMALAEKEERLKALFYNKDYPVFTFWDIGIDDHTAIVFAQFIGRDMNIIDFYENNNEGAEHYVNVLKQKERDLGYRYAQLYLPHDGATREWQSGKSRQETIAKYGFNVHILPAMRVADSLNACRVLWPRIRIDEKLGGFLDSLRNYKRGFNAMTMTSDNEPVHDWSSHAADAFRYMCQAYNLRMATSLKKPEEKRGLTFDAIMRARKRRLSGNS